MTTSSNRFDSIARNYATSEVHRASPSIDLMHELLQVGDALAVCDVAAGAGHFGFSFGSHLARLVAVDPAPKMLELCRAGAANLDLELETIEATAEDMALEPASFDVVCSRLAPHHFHAIEAALANMARATRPGGWVVVIDLQGNEDPRLDGINHQLEVLHDPTHLRSYTPTRWRALFEGAGLVDVALHTDLSERAEGVPVARWCAIANSGAAAEAAIRTLLAETATEDLAAIGIRPDPEHAWLMPVRTVLVIGRTQA